MNTPPHNEPDHPPETLRHSDVPVGRATRPLRWVPALVLIAPMVIAYVWMTWHQGSMIAWAISGPRLAEGRFELIVLHIFAHGGLVHILFNTAALASLGPAVMDRLGELSLRSLAGFLALFFGAGLGGAAFWLALNPDSDIPMLGASGAIFGLLGFLMRQPDPDSAPAPLLSAQLGRAFVELIKLHLPLLALFAIPLLFGAPTFGLAWEAHLGGFIAGLLLCAPILRWCRHGP